MQRVAQDWLVLTVLTEDSGLALGITAGLQFAPMPLLAPVAGTVADRLDRRRILMVTQLSLGLLALILGTLVVTGTARLCQVYLLAAALGVVSAFDGPARHAFVTELVPPDDLPNAVSLNSASFHLGRLIGPGVAGVLIHVFGTGPVFLINAVTFVAVLFALLRMDAGSLRPVRRPPRHGGLREGIRYMWSRPDILVIMAVVGVVGTFSLKFQITTALMARLAFDRGAGEYGLLGSVLAIGSLIGALSVARKERPDVRLVLWATAAFGVTVALAALMPSYPSFALSLIPVGIGALTVMTAASSTVQMTTPAHLRGRMAALYMAVFMGGTPLGAPLVGWIGQVFGPRWSLLVGAFAALGVAGGAALWLSRHPAVVALSADSPAENVDDQEPQRQGHHERQGRHDDRSRGSAFQGAVPLGEQQGITAHR
jgi:MFS family permease